MAYAHMCRSLPEGQADADALLAGLPMPSAAKKQRQRIDTFVMAGGEMVGG